MRMRLRSLEIFLLVIGATIYTIGILFAPVPPFFVYEEATRRKVFNPIWPHSAPELNLVATIGFDIVLLGGFMAILGVVKPRFRRRTRRNS